MKRVIITLLGVVMLSGCVETLQEIRALPPQTKHLNKDTFCVYNKLQGEAIMKQAEIGCAALTWNYHWDPSKRKGMVFPLVDTTGEATFVFDIYDDGKITVLEMRITEYNKGGCYWQYKEIGKSLYADTDYSDCEER